MQGIQALADLDHVAPNGILLNVLVRLLELVRLAGDVAVLCKFHHDIQVILLHESVAVSAKE